jgi:uncharacterized phage protein (TIGR02216 family)
MLVEAVRIGLSPEVFWRLSLREWRMLTETSGGASLGRTAFEILAEGWPDE